MACHQVPRLSRACAGFLRGCELPPSPPLLVYGALMLFSEPVFGLSVAHQGFRLRISKSWLFPRASEAGSASQGQNRNPSHSSQTGECQHKSKRKLSVPRAAMSEEQAWQRTSAETA